MSDRPNALLTNSQREKLLDDEEGYARQHRQRVRERTREGTRDLSLLFREMEERDIEQVFEPDRSVLEETLEILGDIQNNLHGSRLNHRAGRRHPAGELLELVERFEDLTEEIDTIERDLEEYNDSSSESSSARSAKDSKRRRAEKELQERIAHKDQLIEDIKESLKQRIESAESLLSRLEDSEHLLERIRHPQLPEDFRKRLTDIVTTLHDRKQKEEAILELCYSLEEELEYGQIQQNDILYLQDEIDQLRADEGRPRKGPRASLFHQIRDFYHQVDSELSKPEIDPDLRDDFVDACAFFLRVSDVLEIDTEELMEEALISMYEQEHPNEVIEHSIVSLEAIDREAAANAARDKYGKERLSNGELRALAEMEPETLVERREYIRDITDEELLESIRATPGKIEEGLEIEDPHPQRPDSDLVPDLVALDTNGRVVLVDVLTAVVNPEHLYNRMQSLIESYGGKEHARGLVVIPKELEDDFGDLTPLTDLIDIHFVPTRE